MSAVFRATSLALLLLATPGSAHADDLAQMYQRALQSDPTIRKAEANSAAVRARKKQAIGALLPQVEGKTSYDWDHLRDDTTRPLPPFGEAAFVTNTRQEIFRWSVELTQTLFRWDQWVSVQKADKQVLQAEVDYYAAQMNLYVRVAQAYFDILTAEATVESAGAALEAIRNQLEQAQQRFEVGMKAPVDVLEAQSAADRARAAEIRAQRELANAREALREITGDLPGSLAKPGVDIPLAVPEPANEDQWVETAMQQNYRLQAARLGVEIARAGTRIAKSGFLPQVDLVGSYRDYDNADGKETVYYSLFNGPFLTTSSPLDQFGNENVISIQMSMPFFTGGVNSAKVSEAVYRQREAMEQLEITARQTQRATRDAYKSVTSDIAEVNATRQALNSVQQSLLATEAGFEVGTRNTVDLLIARQQLFLAETEFARSRNAYIVDVLRLKEAAGTLETRDIEVINSWLTTR